MNIDKKLYTLKYSPDTRLATSSQTKKNVRLAKLAIVPTFAPQKFMNGTMKIKN